MRILFVEDDDALATVVSDVLRQQHYVVDMAPDGEQGWDYACSFTYDLILLDVSLPKLDGISLCRRLRKDGYNTPVLLLTARDASADKVEGLDAGADDYVVKPCPMEELLARIRALLRRQTAPGAPVLVWGDLSLNPSSCEVVYKGRLIRLTPKEYSLLELFLRHPRHVFSRGAILEHLWSFDTPPGEETVRAHIKGLRRKLKSCGVEDAIETVYGIGYRLKPLPQASSSKEKQTAAAVSEAWEQFKEPILERVTILEEALASLQQDTLDENYRHNAQQQAHKLAGSLGMFGLPEGSRLAREIEACWIALKQPSESNGSIPIHQLESMLAQLRGLVENPEVSEENATIEAELASLPIVPPDSFLDRPSVSAASEGSEPTAEITALPLPPRLLAVDSDRELTQELQISGANWNIEVEVARTPDEARAAIDRSTPHAIVLELTFSDRADDGLVLLEELAAQYPKVPILVCTVRDGFSERVAVARLGGRAFLPKPIPPDRILATVRETLDRYSTFRPRILAVDDDPLILKVLQRFLIPWGIELHTLEDPRQFWQTLEATVPDLLILDVQMPHITGIELCQVVRNDSIWNQLPILFLSGDRDDGTLHRLYQAGADDYVPKPVTEPELMTRIFNRLERLQLLQTIAEIDPLTGVANRSQSTKELYRYLRLANTHNQPMCLAIVDLDRFRHVNETLGHETGDRVLKRIGTILQQKFRSDDLVARWGGEEFAIGMYGMNQYDGIRRLSQVLEAVRSEVFLVKGHAPLRVTVSAGVAEYPHHGKDLTNLYRAADLALDLAKASGRDRICTATPPVPAE
ncbi:MAG: response regulator [Cyanobacteriota bacterium]|nr:response regulator [Cyanobacteriota bacterium]